LSLEENNIQKKFYNFFILSLQSPSHLQIQCYNAVPFPHHYFTVADEKSARVVKLVDTADLKSAAYLNKGRAGSIPAPGTNS
jgi:hypothetical protein